MKIWAKVKLREEQAGLLIRSFFKEFHPESMISIKGDEAEVEIFFENEPPQGIVDAISQCGEIELEYLPNSEKTKKDSKKNKSAKEGEERTENGPKSPVKEITDLKKIAEESNSYENFIENIAKLLELDKRREFFAKMVKVAGELKERISWPNISAELTKEKYAFNNYDHVFCNRHVAEKFNNTIGIMQLIKQIVEYRNYDFSSTEKLSSGGERMQQGIFDLPCFQELIDCVDETQAIDERVKNFLDAIGLSKRTGEEQHRILEVVNMAIKMKDIDFEVVGEKLEMATGEVAGARMILSELFNDYAMQNGCSNKIKVIDFLNELQKVVMTEQEIDDLIS